MRKALFGVFLALFCAVGAMAQSPYKVKVAVDGQDTPVASELETRISATTRYTLTSSPKTARFFLEVDCLKNDSTEGLVWAYTCAWETVYYPSGEKVLFQRSMFGGIVTCPVDAPSYCAEGMFDSFVKSTQPDKLKKYDETAEVEWDAIFALGEEHGYKVGAIGSDSCKGESAQKKPKKVKQP